MTVTWHRVLGDPFGARVQRVEHRADLLAVWHRLSAGQREHLEEGAQEERSVDRWSGHGGASGSPTAETGRLKTSRGKLEHLQSYRRNPRLRRRGEEAAAAGSARISILPPPLPRPQHSARLESGELLRSAQPLPVKLLRCWELLSRSSLAALTLSALCAQTHEPRVDGGWGEGREGARGTAWACACTDLLCLV